MQDELTLDGASILVTGGTGSFGRAFIRHVLSTALPRRVIVFSRDELKQYEMQQAFGDERRLRFFIGDVRDRDRLELAMREVDYVIHAAALKHVPAAEYNPFECIKTNVHGAENVVHAALRTGVRKVLALSTDKAANPINLYGASKLAADKIFIAANSLAGRGGSRFAVVRYGNVLCSSGSVLPYFTRLKREGADHLPITDPRMTRFWITLPQAVDFVLTSLALMRGGEIFIPKLPSMRLDVLARCIAPKLEQRVVGVRPGEKLHEVMVTQDDARSTVELADRFVIKPAFPFWGGGDRGLPGERPVAEDFRYASDTNDDWLDCERLQALLESAGFAG